MQHTLFFLSFLIVQYPHLYYPLHPILGSPLLTIVFSRLLITGSRSPSLAQLSFYSSQPIPFDLPTVYPFLFLILSHASIGVLGTSFRLACKATYRILLLPPFACSDFHTTLLQEQLRRHLPSPDNVFSIPHMIFKRQWIKSLP